jgi:SAM-dependent methyltransferase
MRSPHDPGNPDVQTEYWEGAPASREFSHPVPLALLRGLLPLSARILDYGCGYGRTCAELVEAGYRDVVGIDISRKLVQRGRRRHPGLDLRVFDGRSTGFADASFDGCLLVAVLNCVPSDAGREDVVGELRRLLRPGGILFISDYPLQTDPRNVERYRQFEKEFGTYGVFRADGAVFRHQDMRRVIGLLSGFEILWQGALRVSTMHGNAADAFQLLARKSGAPPPQVAERDPASTAGGCAAP